MYNRSEAFPQKEQFPLQGIRAAILDMDGLMVDTEPLHHAAFRSVLLPFGVDMSEQEYTVFHGIADRDIAAVMIAQFNLTLSSEELVRMKKAKFAGVLERGIIPKTGLDTLLHGLREKKLSTAIASSSLLRDIDTIARGLDVRDFFDVYVSGEEVERGKPEPDIFLLAAERLGMKPSECLVLEDSPSGIQAASAAGMRSFAIPTPETSNKDFSRATLQLESLSDVLQHIA